MFALQVVFLFLAVDCLRLPVYNNTPDYLHFSLPVHFFNSSFNQNLSLTLDTGSRTLIVFHEKLEIPKSNFECGCTNRNLTLETDAICMVTEQSSEVCLQLNEWCDWNDLDDPAFCDFRSRGTDEEPPATELYIDGQVLTIGLDASIAGRTMMSVVENQWNMSALLEASQPAKLSNKQFENPPGVQTVESWGDGVIGLLPPPLSNDLPKKRQVGSFWEITNEEIGTYALDLNTPPAPSYIDVNEVSPQWQESLTPANWFGFNTFFRFDMFDLELCGQPLFLAHPSDSYVSHFPVMTDTGASCLGLPHHFYSMLLKYVPFNCNETLTDCILADNVSGQLPSLSFSLQEDGELFYIPLDNLLIEKERGKKLCIFDMSDASGSWDPTMRYSIAFGTRALFALYAQFDVTDREHPQMAFANKVDPKTLSNANCIPKAKCVGDQTFDDLSNSCKDYPCNDYYFYTLDEKSRTCRLSGHFTEVVVILSVAVLTLEFGFSQMRLHLLQRLRTVCDPI